MKRNLVEVFVERDCPSCEEVRSMLNNYSDHPSVDVQIYEREKDKATFQGRHVLVCPATFINQRLAFYGVFTVSEFVRFLS
jgi:glutaredoxin